MNVFLKAVYWTALWTVPGALVVWASWPQAQRLGRRLRSRRLDLPKPMGNDEHPPPGTSRVYTPRTCNTNKKEVSS